LLAGLLAGFLPQDKFLEKNGGIQKKGKIV
jgi:hypothetical protein